MTTLQNFFGTYHVKESSSFGLYCQSYKALGMIVNYTTLEFYYKQFFRQYDSRVVIYNCKPFQSLATGVKS